MDPVSRTTPATSGVSLDKKVLKRLMRRSDAKPLLWCAAMILLLTVTAALYWTSFGTWLVIPACLLYSSILATFLYALSHECAHGTAFRSRWLNETVFWISSLWYFEEPYQRRYTHASHHSYTWINGKDAQMPFAHRPLTLWGWFVEVSGLWLTAFEAKALVQNACGRIPAEVRRCAPESEWPKLIWNARAFLAVYGVGTAISVAVGWTWPLYLIVIPRFVGGPVMTLLILMQHVEMAEDQHDLTRSTRSFRTNPFVRLIYCNMNHHIEHHLYPTVPFYALPRLSEALGGQLPEPDPGLLRTSLAVLRIVARRSLGLEGQAPGIRQTIAEPLSK